MIPGFSQLDYMTRLNRLNLWTLEERRNRSDLIELFKIYKGVSGIKVESMFEPSTDSRTRGHLLKLMKHRSRLDLRKYFFSERVVNRWNELDEDTVSATTVNMFKSRLQRLRSSRQAFTRTLSVLQASRPHLEEVNPGAAAPGNSPGKKKPLYLHNLISIQRPRSTLSSSVVTLARPPSSIIILHRNN